jgi:hypothetical protein
MKLVNGLGQLGEALSKVKCDRDITIYHTWNPFDKTEEIQKECYDKFKEYVDNHDEFIVFISTHSKKKNPYVSYKRKAEKYLKKGIYVRLPILIGKGAFEKFRDNAPAYGVMEIITIQDAVKEILKAETSKTVKGIKIPAKIVKKLILIGKNGV